MSLQHSIQALYDKGWSKRRTARELGIDRGSIHRYVAAKPAISPLGSSPPSTAGRHSLCLAWCDVITLTCDAGLSAQRIYHDLVRNQQFSGSYDSVKRFVHRLRSVVPMPFRRMEVEPCAEAQVDFGQSAFVVQGSKRKQPHLFRLVLGHARKGYSEVVWRQTTEAFVRWLENAFRLLWQRSRLRGHRQPPLRGCQSRLV